MKKALISPLKLLLVFLFALGLAACGQRGPLYLPEEQAPPPVDESVTDDEEEDEAIGA